MLLPHIGGSFLHGASFYDRDHLVMGLTVRGKDADVLISPEQCEPLPLIEDGRFTTRVERYPGTVYQSLYLQVQAL